MEKRKLFNTKMIATTGVLVGIEIILQIIGNYIAPGFTNINLSLIPIAMGAILYGPLVGGFLGLICGVMVLVSPSTIQFFFAINPFGTVVTCILKTTLAGLAAGFTMKLFKNEKKFIGSIVASFLVPFLNTAIFALFASIFFVPALLGMVQAEGSIFTNIAEALFLGMIGVNFIFEVVSTMIVTPSLYKVLEHQKLTVSED